MNNYLKSDQMTEKERAILTLICAGKTQKEIASEMFMAPGTLETTIAKMRKRFSCANTTQLAVYFKEQELKKVRKTV